MLSPDTSCSGSPRRFSRCREVMITFTAGACSSNPGCHRKRGQWHEESAGGVAREAFRSQLQRQARFAPPAWSDEGQQPAAFLFQLLVQEGTLSLPANEAGRRLHQV